MKYWKDKANMRKWVELDAITIQDSKIMGDIT